MDSKDWAKREFENADLGDLRLTQRLVKISQQFIDSPESHINKACGDWGDTKAAYRFFQNQNVDYQEIHQAHANQTRMRCESEEVVLAIQDTTYYNYTNHPETKGLGVLSRFKGKHKDDILTLGLCMHTTLAVSTQGLPLGILDQNIYAREVLSPEKIALKKRTRNTDLPIEKKESIRWLASMKKSDSILGSKNRQVVTIADREADIYDLYRLADRLGSHFLVRAAQNRRVNKTAIHSEISGELLQDLMHKQKVQGRIQIDVPKKKKQPKRIACCNVKYSKINILPSRHFKGSKLGDISLEVYAIHLIEKTPPSGSDRIEWMLLTNIPIESLDQALEKVKWYCLRWRIEVYFKVIKSGFKVEDCRLENADRLIRYLAVVSIVAWRVYWLTLVSRSEPDAPAELFLNDFEWQILFLKFNPEHRIPKRPPSLKQVTLWIARLGGFLSRKGDGEPGVTHMWRGLNKFAAIIDGAKISRSICG